VAMRWRAGP